MITAKGDNFISWGDFIVSGENMTTEEIEIEEEEAAEQQYKNDTSILQRKKE